MVKQIFILIMFVLSATSYNVSAGDVDNKIILEKLESLSRRIDDKFDAVNGRIDDTNRRIDDLRDSVNKRIDDSRSYDIAIIISILSLMAMILWDRRNALKPIYEQLKELKERLDFVWEHFQTDQKQGLQKFKLV